MIRIGIDVGGTGIQIGAVDENFHIIVQDSIPTRTDLPFSEQMRQMTDCVQKMLSPASGSGLCLDDIASVGVGVPGIADREGNVIRCTNMGWENVPFRKVFTEYLDKPLFIDNDANVAALAESVAGVSKGTSSSVFITLGTGIGSGIILNGRIWSGFHGAGGELGHTILMSGGTPCTCGNRGCTERYCSATALIHMAREAVEIHPESEILTVAGSPDKINAKVVIDAAKHGDSLAEELFRRFVSYLAQTIANVVNFLDPEVIVLGGGVSKAGNFLLDAVQKEYPHYVLFNTLPLPDIKLAVLGADAGIIGASMLS